MIGLSVPEKSLIVEDRCRFYDLETNWMSDLMKEIASKFGVECRMAYDGSRSILIGTTLRAGRDVRMTTNIPDICLQRGELEIDNVISISNALKKKFPDHEIKLIFYNYIGNDLP